MSAPAKDAVADVLGFLAARRSAKEFAALPLSLVAYRRLQRAAAEAPQSLGRGCPALHLYSVPLLVDAAPDFGVEKTRLGAGEWSPCARVEGADQAETWSRACQGQAIVRRASCLLIVGVSAPSLAEGPYDGFRRAALSAGLLLGWLYRSAARLGIGTTSIGGFSDDAVARTLGEREFLPVAAQAFGPPVTVTRKVDKARVVFGVSRQLGE